MNPHEDFDRSISRFNWHTPQPSNNWGSPTALTGSSPRAFPGTFTPQDTTVSTSSPQFTFGATSTHVSQEQSSGSKPVAAAAMQVPNNDNGAFSTATAHSQPSVMIAPPKPAALQRNKYRGLNWGAQKPHIKKLYLEGENSLSLRDTMRIMEEEHGFKASEKLYKEKFKQWGWQKKLPAEYAQWMVFKAKERYDETRKGTEFIYGGLRWTKERAESSAKRAKKGEAPEAIVSTNTPADIAYETPQYSQGPSPEAHPAEAMEGVMTATTPIRDEVSTSNESDDDVADAAPIQLSFQGSSRTTLMATFEAAKSAQHRGDTESAEQMFIEVLAGYGHILGSTHDDTRKVAYALATFYAETGRMDDAEKIIEEITHRVLDRFGVEGMISQQHVLHVVELLNAWDRPVDALAFLNRAKDIYAAASKDDHDCTCKKQKSRKRRGRSSHRSKISKTQIGDITNSIVQDADPAMINHGIGVARSHVAVKDGAAEALLQAIIKNCNADRTGLAIENLEARSELLKLYEKLGTVQENKRAFTEALQSFCFIWDNVMFDFETFKSFEVMEACLKLAVCFLKVHFDSEAESIFRKVEEKAVAIFHGDDERTIWILVSIGLVYQTQRGWSVARRWFDEAYVFALDAYDEKDGILRALQVAREKEHFSYLSDEGRPFKTIFGVSGITIRPGRLHIE